MEKLFSSAPNLRCMDFDIDAIASLAVKAGERIMAVYDDEDNAGWTMLKSDCTPLTMADVESNMLITAGLKEMYPEIPVISEEEQVPEYEERRSWRRFWLVDPLDGTEEFISGSGEFTVNIGLIEDGRPVLGVIYLPAMDILYYGDARGSFKKEAGWEPQRIQTWKGAEADRKYLVATFNSRHMCEDDRQFLDRNGITNFIDVGSSIKFCLVAEGTADVYYRGGRTREWDTAAGQAIVENAGGRVCDLARQPVYYNKESMRNNPFICMGSRSDFDPTRTG